MSTCKRYSNNPILSPKSDYYWERRAAFNGCPVRDGRKLKLLYRALSDTKYNNGAMMNVSSIGLGTDWHDGTFHEHEQFIRPNEIWDCYGCEDPRVTKFNGKYYIFYTALSAYPFRPEGIKIGLAITRDFKKIEKHQVTTFNSKAMALFPEKINGKMVAILTANTDQPPAKIALAYFDREEEIWSKQYWNEWYENIDQYKIDFGQKKEDHIEIGAPPILTKKGWLLVYSYIKNYFSNDETVFEIKAILLDRKNPQKVLGRSETMMRPEETYEHYGMVPNIIFPSGAYIDGDMLHVFYGAADTTCCAAKFKLSRLLADMLMPPEHKFSLKRYAKNPILKPTKRDWEERAVFNTAALYLDNKFHIVYRAMAKNGRSVLGYATSRDGFKIDKRYGKPIYVPRESFEIKNSDGNSGCEDPRLILFEDRIYIFYTAYDGNNPPAVALSSISVDNFLKQNWDWERPKLISDLRDMNKDACIFPERINGKIVALHRMNDSIDIVFMDNMDFSECRLCEENNWIVPRKGMWDSRKVGIAGVPIKTKYGWILIYHGISDHNKYRLGAILLDLKNPEKILARTEKPILEPIEKYEIEGEVPNVVFSCGAVMKNNLIYVYYGGADKVIGVATIKLDDLIRELKDAICH